MYKQRSHGNYASSKTMLNLVRRFALALAMIAAVLFVCTTRMRKTEAARPIRLAQAMTVVLSVAVTEDTPTPSDNDYTRINNAIQSAMSGDSIELIGIFDWTETNAAASWANGSNGTSGDGDDFSILVPAGLNSVTLMASSPGSATIQGPGDLAAVNLEGFLVFDGGDNQNWTISNLRIVNFDLGIGMFFGAGGADAFNGTRIQDNFFLVPADLNATVAPADVNQNIAIHYAHGSNQTISGNTIEIAGDGVSDSANSIFAASVGMQSNSSGNNGVYDGLLIDNNTVRVLNAQSADPETVLGIWENALDHSSDITVSNNDFINAAAGNNPQLNLQRAFRVTSHSSLTTMTTYSNNTATGANIGFQWLAGSNFAGNQPVELVTNVVTNCNTGVLVQSNGIAHLTDNQIIGPGTTGTGVNIMTGSATIDAAAEPNEIRGLATGINVDSAATINGNVIVNNTTGVGVSGSATAVNMSFNRIVGNVTGLSSAAATPVNAENNWWGCNAGPGGAGCDSVSGNLDFNPWLVLSISAVPGTVGFGQTSTITASLTRNSDGVDTSASGHVPDGTLVTFGGGAPLGTVAPPSALTVSGMATAVFTAGSLGGTATVSATVDNQTVTTNIVVTIPAGSTCALDDGSGNFLALNTTTGDYIVTRCSTGFILSGRGTVRIVGCSIYLQHNATDRRVAATINTCQKKGSASVQTFSPSMLFTITDRNTANNTCVCP